MRHIKNPTEFRLNVRKELTKLIGNENISENISENLEKGIYNWCIQESNKKNIVKKWDNVYFTHIYLDRLKTVIFNLRDETLLEKLKTKGGYLKDGFVVDTNSEEDIVSVSDEEEDFEGDSGKESDDETGSELEEEEYNYTDED